MPQARNNPTDWCVWVYEVASVLWHNARWATGMPARAGVSWHNTRVPCCLMAQCQMSQINNNNDTTNSNQHITQESELQLLPPNTTIKNLYLLSTLARSSTLHTSISTNLEHIQRQTSIATDISGYNIHLVYHRTAQGFSEGAASAADNVSLQKSHW